jgi:6-phosphofructokinase 2
MIYTITLNPALDRTLWVTKIMADDSNRIEQERRYAGGKGVDVSKVLTTLGVENKALGFVGGFAGEEVEGLLLNEGILCEFVRISNETRTNIIVNDQSTGNQMVLSARGPEIKPYELMRLIHKVEKLEQPDIVILSGSFPPGIHPDISRKIIELVKSQGAKVIMDADGETLKIGIHGCPDVIKPNIHELSRLVGADLKNRTDIIDAARRVRDQGVAVVLVSMGADGMLLVSDKETWLASPPQVKVKNTIGAGDSAIAGYVYALVAGKPAEEALTWAVATGTATTLRTGTALCQKEDVLQLLPKVELQSVPV